MSEHPPDYYAILGIPETASDEDIARAYRRLARENHPDSPMGGDVARFRDATAAYDVIGDGDRRGAYDASRRHGGQRGTAIPVRQGPPSRPAGAPQAGDLGLSFEEAVLGTTARVQVDTPASCPTCQGSGRHRAGPEVCPVCDGSGASVRRSGEITIRHQCIRCEGTGQLPPAPCVACEGEGWVRRSRAVAVRIPPGVADGSRVRIPLGRESKDAVFATVRVRPHPYLTRRGRDLALRVPITLAEAALGTELRVPTVGGRHVSFFIPPGTNHGRTFRVSGGGVPHPSGPGDLVVTVEIDVPASLSDAQRRALEAYAAATPSPRAHLGEGAQQAS